MHAAMLFNLCIKEKQSSYLNKTHSANSVVLYLSDVNIKKQ